MTDEIHRRIFTMMVALEGEVGGGLVVHGDLSESGVGGSGG